MCILSFMLIVTTQRKENRVLNSFFKCMHCCAFTHINIWFYWVNIGKIPKYHYSIINEWPSEALKPEYFIKKVKTGNRDGIHTMYTCIYCNIYNTYSIDKDKVLALWTLMHTKQNKQRTKSKKTNKHIQTSSYRKTVTSGPLEEYTFRGIVHRSIALTFSKLMRKNNR